MNHIEDTDITANRDPLRLVQHLLDTKDRPRRSIDAGTVRAYIVEECNALRDMLVEKNEAYGNSALDPVRIFSRADPVEQIKVRIDDKLSRLARGSAAGEDAVLDLMGYLVLLRVAKRLPA